MGSLFSTRTKEKIIEVETHKNSPKKVAMLTPFLATKTRCSVYAKTYNNQRGYYNGETLKKDTENNQGPMTT